MGTKGSLVGAMRCALRGIGLAWRSERNLRIHSLAVVVSSAGAWALGFSQLEWAVLALTWALVLGAEMINSSIEALCDHLHPARHPQIARVKDVAAGAVLVCALVAVIVGTLLFGPKLVVLLGC
ncbi:diacylglycerol kinase [Sulfuriroseicoccus oceanibius]|uniref:Diacylglycerol kinase family protein n=1 Tax=Sulfuriroseicoccus oceanibius TaxID=2707525 RepID=A0A6B3LB47_9BACT|nr:diacylglycerol kinase family protein [Sulfuriroseicoccus oceanibius]QQL45262.1 diacylglycerol kinase family protein [Sulfuriroseicoccus oceanibius]